MQPRLAINSTACSNAIRCVAGSKGQGTRVRTSRLRANILATSEHRTFIVHTGRTPSMMSTNYRCLACLAALCGALSIHATAAGQDSGDRMEKKLELLKPWPGPYGGVPPWNLVQPDV